KSRSSGRSSSFAIPFREHFWVSGDARFRWSDSFFDQFQSLFDRPRQDNSIANFDYGPLDDTREFHHGRYYFLLSRIGIDPGRFEIRLRASQHVKGFHPGLPEQISKLFLRERFDKIIHLLPIDAVLLKQLIQLAARGAGWLFVNRDIHTFQKSLK